MSAARRGYRVPDRVGRGESDYLASSPYLTRTPPFLFCSFTAVLQFAMNGFDSKGLDEDAFGEKSALSGLKTFDAFRKSPWSERCAYTDMRSANQPQTLPQSHNHYETKTWQANFPTLNSENKSFLHNPNPPRWPMDRPYSPRLHCLQLLRTKNMVAWHRTAPLQCGEGRLP